MERTVVAALLLLSAANCAPQRQEWQNDFSGDGEDLFLVDDDLVCLADDSWTVVGGTRVANPLGHADEAVSVAEAGESGVDFPIGTILQLFPTEVSVKRGAGYSADTDDWEFLKLDVGSGRTVITERGTTQIGNPAGSCIGCHSAAKDFDNACFTNDSCAPLPFFIDTDVQPERDDARCQ